MEFGNLKENLWDVQKFGRNFPGIPGISAIPFPAEFRDGLGLILELSEFQGNPGKIPGKGKSKES